MLASLTTLNKFADLTQICFYNNPEPVRGGSHDSTAWSSLVFTEIIIILTFSILSNENIYIIMQNLSKYSIKNKYTFCLKSSVEFTLHL